MNKQFATILDRSVVFDEYRSMFYIDGGWYKILTPTFDSTLVSPEDAWDNDIFRINFHNSLYDLLHTFDAIEAEAPHVMCNFGADIELHAQEQIQTDGEHVVNLIIKEYRAGDYVLPIYKDKFRADWLLDKQHGDDKQSSVLDLVCRLACIRSRYYQEWYNPMGRDHVELTGMLEKFETEIIHIHTNYLAQLAATCNCKDCLRMKGGE